MLLVTHKTFLEWTVSFTVSFYVEEEERAVLYPAALFTVKYVVIAPCMVNYTSLRGIHVPCSRVEREICIA